MVFAYKDASGQTCYKGLPTSAEIMQADCRITHTKATLKPIEKDHKACYGTNGLYAFYLGTTLNDCMERYGVSAAQTEDFLTEVASFTLPKASVKSLLAYSRIAKVLTITVAEKMTTKQLEQLFSKPEYTEDSRLFDWIEETPLTAEAWKKFFPSLKSWLKRKDMSVFSDKEAFEIYDKLLTA